MLLEVNPDREKIVDHPYSYCNGEVPPDPQFSRRAYDLFQLQPGQEVMVKAKRQVGPLVTIHHIGWNGKDLVLSQSAPRDDMVFVGTDRLQILPRELQEIEAIISDRTGSAEQLLAGVEKLKAVQSKCLTAGLGLGFARHALALGKSLERIGCVAEATAVTKLALAPLYAVPGDSSTELDSLRREVTVELQRMRLLCPPQTDSRGVSAK
jgi:hypothetical protein